jgi:hemerythrin
MVMEKIKWTKDYSVGIKQFDEQHEKLFSYLSELYEALDNQKNSQEIVSKTLNDLIIYTFFHFTNEEFYMKKYSYPELDLHIDEHDKLRKKVLAYQEDLNNGKKVIQVKELADFLTDWIKDHVLKTDKNYESFFKKSNILG